MRRTATVGDDHEPPWVIVGCGRLKHDQPMPAADLYRSAYLTCAVRWARSVTIPGRLLVLSAKHGLIDGRIVIAPYDVAFTGPSSLHAVANATIDAQAHAFGLRGFAPHGEVLMLAGQVYLDRFWAATGGRVRPRNPFADRLRDQNVVPGMGHQMHLMNQSTGMIPLPNGGVRLVSPARDPHTTATTSGEPPEEPRPSGRFTAI